MPTPVFHGKVEGHKIHLERRDDFQAHIASLEGRDIELVLRREVRRRSQGQNKKIHKLIKIIADYCGYTLEEMKGILKWEYGIQHTSEQDTGESGEFIEFVIRRGAELGVGGLTGDFE